MISSTKDKIGKDRFVPSHFQVPLPQSELIKNFLPEGENVVPLDVVFVGAGPSGLAGAIELSRLVKKDRESGGSLSSLEIGVLDKANSLGGHNLSGAVINPVSLQELFPELNLKDFPFRRPVEEEKVFFMSESGHYKIPTPPTMCNQGNYIASICEVVRWMGQKAEEMGVNIFCGFPANGLHVQENRVVGVSTAASGLDRQGQPGSQYNPGTEITAQVTVLAEGTRGLLTQAYTQWQNIGSTLPQIYALGVKEIWRVKKAPKEIIHTMGWPLPKDAFGGSFLYPLAEDLVAIGLVVGLDYRQSHLDVHHLLQNLKQHKLFKPILEGGECIEWGAKTIPEGGYHALPERMYGDGVLILGDAAGLVNVPALKGIHYAIQSGIYGARAIYAALKNGDVSAKSLKSYDETLRSSYVFEDLKKVRNMRHAFKSGFYLGGLKAGLMTLTGGTFPGASSHGLEDAEEWKEISRHNTPLAQVGMSKVDAVYLSGNKTRDDIPSHLKVGKDVTAEIAEFYSHLCPAGVYERRGDDLVVNAPNCVDCKATDVLGPRWQPREGGSGPNYNMM
ncbi:MAG: electron transfer flavoprotein-ubiquinone oxidoreductase [Bdellovibrionales bacterium]|nr:electron transfer flavoprotein-ubiquinone oxidoreductase [Bdellovibrionales bacterium]